MMCMIKKGVIGGTLFTVDFLLKLTTTSWLLLQSHADINFGHVQLFWYSGLKKKGLDCCIPIFWNCVWNILGVEWWTTWTTSRYLQFRLVLHWNDCWCTKRGNSSGEGMSCIAEESLCFLEQWCGWNHASKTTWVILVVNKGGELSYNFTNEVLW